MLSVDIHRRETVDGHLRDVIVCPMHMHSIGQTIKWHFLGVARDFRAYCQLR